MRPIKSLLLLFALCLCVGIGNATEFKTDKTVQYEHVFIANPDQVATVESISFEDISHAFVLVVDVQDQSISVSDFSARYQDRYRNRDAKPKPRNHNFRNTSARKLHYRDLKLLPAERSYLRNHSWSTIKLI